ncbi:hypothetical protein AGABI1DRAFT_135213 [Agaricus bisporus var. burnettii JB137-S8]|uniref:Uncharacterized protein n=1 Tax=Agaricus bisporus var. burnettii (strain JB137-S8 / ATCC MYA-4627 / FGSC 10392) TaxID=597362 RepID=K5WRU8_AGABU|nr:uncharacterized protein AGABI1DRAFT_135213 [Agaricus bisporus var. burnettii JB137-S8]EKM73257.1 hypothetical protein AGABI1DRAFT_135213 [Agaricus bisporus var. burnettii JB137-S8]
MTVDPSSSPPSFLPSPSLPLPPHCSPRLIFKTLFLPILDAFLGDFWRVI